MESGNMMMASRHAKLEFLCDTQEVIGFARTPKHGML